MGTGAGHVVVAPVDEHDPPTVLTTPSPPGSWPGWLSGRTANVVAVACFAFVVVMTFLFIHRYAVGMTYSDQWSDVELIRRAHNGTLTLGALWAQHNENRILFPNLLVLLLYYTTHYNVVVEDYLNGIALCGSAALVILTHRRRSPGTPLIAYVPVALVLLSGAVTIDALYGFNLSWCLGLLAFGATLFLVDRRELTWLWLAAAVATAVVGSFSTLQGMLIWPAVLILLWLRRRSRATIGTWIAGMLATTAVFFFHFSMAATGVGATTSRGIPSMTVFGISEFGNVIGSQELGHTDFVIGACVLGVTVVALVVGLRRDRVGGAPVGVALLVFGLLFVAVAAKGRTYLGLTVALRYAPFVLDVWVGSYLVLLSYLGAPATSDGAGAGTDGVQAEQGVGPWRLRNWAGVAFAGLCVAMLLQAVVSWSEGNADARGWRGLERNVANVEANIDTASDALVADRLGPYSASWMRSLTQFERAQRLNLFGTGQATAAVRRGLDPKLVAVVVVPTNWTVVSGKVLLDTSAYASHIVGVAFLAEGPGFPMQVVSGSVPTVDGIIGQWDTSHVPNGNYRIYSRVRVASGRSYTSAPVVVWVFNKP